MAQLKSTVYVQDPDTHQTVTLEPGTNPPAHLAELVTNPAAWVDGKLPAAAKKAAAGDTGDAGNGQGDAAGSVSAAETAPSEEDEGDKPAAKRAATRPARGRKSAADEGSGS
ncbi:hypothetical protein [Streptomyces olivaceiscleroticus]|uniref:Uncharacterized protein n=1 Tax=Streptomyces olivaceiscleroticus TaxID=68245 RepID=A0ABN1BQ13_9ACTN